MERTNSNVTIEKRSYGSFGSMVSKLSQISRLLSFSSRADDCISRSSQISVSNSWSWMLYQSHQQTQIDDYYDKLQEALLREDSTQADYYRYKIQELETQPVSDYSQLDGDRLPPDSLKVQGRRQHQSIPVMN